jgi:hypothetical protein
LKRRFAWVFICLVSGFLSGCRSYYYANEEFNQAFQRGDFQFCETWLRKQKPKKRAKDKFLYHANTGMVHFIQNKEDTSNQDFEKSFLIAEDFQQKAGENVAALLTNPKRITYAGERHEQFLILYFKALNLLKKRQYETALIEARRLIRKMNVLEDKDKKNYNSDGFLLWMIGSIFEAAGELNNAYIYFKKSTEAYQGTFGAMTALSIPRQLKLDLIRCAYLSGFEAEAKSFESKFGLQNKPLASNQGMAMLIFHKGLGPVKSENRIVFQLLKGAGGQVMFTNEEWGLNFPFFLPPGESSQPNRLDNLKIVTMAWPKYEFRSRSNQTLNLEVAGQNFSFEKASDINKIAVADLKDRMLIEMAISISRVAIKQAVQYLATKATKEAVKSGDGTKAKKQEQADLAGSLVNLAFTIANTATEVADTRNWQTLPAEIEIVKIPLEAGKRTITLRNQGDNKGNISIELDILPGQTTLHTVHGF